MTEPSKEDLLNCFDGMCVFLATHGFTEKDERAVAIRKLIEKKPKVTREFVGKWTERIYCDRKSIRAIRNNLEELFEEAGVEKVK